MKNKHLFYILFIIFITFILLLANIKPNTYFTGWDNSHPEFNLGLFTKRIISGAWVSFQGTGAPAAQSQLAEIPRLPLIFLLKLILPDNLIRYVFSFLMVCIGGIGTYLYLYLYWLNLSDEKFRKIIALFGALFYILNIISLQQFYINFEMYSVEFAFFPFVLTSIHLLNKNFNPKNLLIFTLFQLLFAPVAYVPTVFYFGAFFWLIYAFFLNLQYKKNILLAIKKTLIISLLIFIINSFWLIPNLYYTIHNSHYVKESRSNQLFNQEAISSVKEAANFENFITGIHYLFTWKQFDFEKKQYQPIFQPWLEHLLNNNLVIFFLTIFQILSLSGFFITLFDKKCGIKRYGLILIYLINFIFIWMGLFLPDKIIDIIYKFQVIKEAFRNPFTKLSNYYSFTITILIVISIKQIFYQLSQLKIHFKSLFISFLTIFLFLSLFYTFLPSFKGYFINPKLKTKIPSEYFEMFSFLKTKSENLRILELPFLSHSGWLYYDWQFLEKNNGYQGMGFYFFGIPQSLLTPDHARWTETTDFFYAELKQALNSENIFLLQNILKKYRVNLIIVDESSMWGNLYYDHQKIHQILFNLKYPIIWKKNFLTIYKVNENNNNQFIIPEKINLIKTEMKRVKIDYIYQNLDDYINLKNEKTNPNYIYPFANITDVNFKENISFNSDGYSIKKNLNNPGKNYQLIIPIEKMINNNYYSTPAELKYIDGKLSIRFPKIKIIFNNDENKSIFFPQIKNIFFYLKDKYPSIILLINEKIIKINNGEIIYPTFNFSLSSPIDVSYIEEENGTPTNRTINIEKIQPNWIDFKKNIVVVNNEGINTINIKVNFPLIKADLSAFSTENCSNPKQGTIKTINKNGEFFYQAFDYAVNCHHYDFKNIEFNCPYIVNIEGENFKGRGLKFFINYRKKNSLNDEYLTAKNKFSSKFILLPINDYNGKYPAINWEVRSHGKNALSKLSLLETTFFPVPLIANIHFEKNNSFPFTNNISIEKSGSFLNFLYWAKINCKSENCYFGINQSFDDLWLAIDNKLNLLNHYKFNNWANIWELKGNQKTILIIFYLPQILSFLSIIFLAIFIGFVVIKLINRNQKLIFTKNQIHSC